MRLRFIGSEEELLGNATYIPLSELSGALDFWVEDCDGFQLDQIFLDEIPERRNGLPSHSYSYSFDGVMRVFPLFNNSDEDTETMMKLDDLMVYPCTYICPFEDDGTPTYDERGRSILKRIIQNDEPSAIRVCFQNKPTMDNNGISANKEFDLMFSVWGIWNRNGLLPAFRN